MGVQNSLLAPARFRSAKRAMRLASPCLQKNAGTTFARVGEGRPDRPYRPEPQNAQTRVFPVRSARPRYSAPHQRSDSIRRRDIGVSERDVRWEDCTAAAKRNNRDQLPGFVHWASKEQSAKRDFTRFLY